MKQVTKLLSGLFLAGMTMLYVEMCHDCGGAYYLIIDPFSVFVITITLYLLISYTRHSLVSTPLFTLAGRAVESTADIDLTTAHLEATWALPTFWLTYDADA